MQSQKRPRLEAIDTLRGLVMVLMTIDHASGAFNAGRVMSDSVRSYTPGTHLDPQQFATRWIAHLCAPTFVFLAGVSLALSEQRRRARGEPPGKHDRFLVQRGLFIAACDPLWMTWGFGIPSGKVLFQVLYAIGVGFVAMAALRRVPARWLAMGALTFIASHEALATLVAPLTHGPLGPPIALLLTGGSVGPIMVAYPALPWLAVMALGHAAGERFAAEEPNRLAIRAALAGAVALVLFAIVRGCDGYGNLHLLRDDGSLLQWLHVSKYPPSLSYLALELGLSWVLLAALLRVPAGAKAVAPLVLLGQTAFIFYLLHVHLLHGAARALGLEHHAGLGATYLAAGITALALMPVCAAYRRYKAAHPEGWARYV